MDKNFEPLVNNILNTLRAVFKANVDATKCRLGCRTLQV